MSESEPVTVRTEDGWVLRGEAIAAGDGRGVAVLGHAMMASRRTLDRPRGKGLASALAAEGLGVVMFDLRGHGESGPSARDGGAYTYDDFVLRDIPALVAFARERFGGQRVALVGHSLAAHAGLALAGVFPERGPDAMVSIAGNIWLPSLESSRLRGAAKAAFLRGWLAVTERWGHFDPRPLRMGTDAVALPYVRQFWQMWSEDRFGSIDGGTDYLTALGRVKIPVFSVASEGDRLLAHPESVARFMDLVGSARKASRVVRHGELGEKAPDHMGLVTRTSSAPVWGQIARWLREELGR
ncbi:alpha/beta fold hydrolase [Polyangium aurulentum]|uniref:alpha/beta fold hydrolase n=1 Tax=Polyangium aurulentum TaxID=2567896 RepID=UPI001469CD65|nr:alpha/beta fold hydrolase [Polyangium aurulentum]UQA61963.1 alpha/beta fold hydrolase [Polyangium aurulentum]